MKPFDFPLLTDENIHPGIVAFLRERGCDVLSVSEQGNYGLADIEVLRLARKSKRVVLTHDSDFGGLAVLNKQPFTGIVYLRPGHISSEFIIQTLNAIVKRAPDVTPPFILVAERTGNDVKIRIRQLLQIAWDRSRFYCEGQILCLLFLFSPVRISVPAGFLFPDPQSPDPFSYIFPDLPTPFTIRIVA